MERYFYRRGDRVLVNQLEDVVAVQVELDAQSDSVGPASPLGELATEARAAGPVIDLAEDEARALAQAGWSFIASAEPAERAMESRELPEDIRDVNTVFQQDDGHVLIGTQTLTVQFRPDMAEPDVRTRLEELGLTIVRELRFSPNQFEVQIRPGADLLDTANAVQESEDTIYAEPTFVEYIGQRFTPTDPMYRQQWHLNNPGGPGAVAGADISAEHAWNFTRGQGMRIAVIDNGFDVTHGDLAPGIDAGSGFFDSRSNFQRTVTGYPNDDHGTFCAGMAAARQNNGVDGCGSAPESQLLLVASLFDQLGSQATLARAVAYCADPSMEVPGADPASGADVIVSSLGPNGADWALTTVLQNAMVFATNRGRKGRGTPIFWASSNGNVDIARDQVVSHAAVIAVGRSRRDDREDNSARGQELDFLAPGVNVVSTAQGGGTRTDTGTSFAAPLAAGVGALVLSVNPDLFAEDVRHIIKDTCDKIGGVGYDANGHHLDYGHGRVNAHRAVMEAMHSRTANGAARMDFDGDSIGETFVESPWGIGILEFSGGTLNAQAMEPNGSRFDGWLLNTVDNHFRLTGDFDGDGRSEMLVTSPWGIGVLNLAGATFSASMLKPNGTRFGGWLLNTADNQFGPVGDFDGDGQDEILVRSPWGISVFKRSGDTFSTAMIAPNGTRFGGWLLNTADNHFGPVGDFDGDGRDEVLVRSPWGIGILELAGATFDAPTMAPNGTRFGGWLLNTADNWFGPTGDFDGDGAHELVVSSPWGIGVLDRVGTTFDAAMLAPNGTRFGGWLLNTHDNRVCGAADFDADGRDELFVSSPWGIGVLELVSGGLDSVMLAPNGTRFGGWLLNTADNHFRRFVDLTGDGRANVLIESPWGIGIFTLSGTSFDEAMLAPNGTRFGGWLLNTHDNRF